MNRERVRMTTVTDTAHIAGAGVMRLSNRQPCWHGIDGKQTLLHTQGLRRVLLYGVADVTGAALRFFWRNGIQVIFMSPGGRRVLGTVQPAPGRSPSLTLWQHRAADDVEFCLDFSRRLVLEKIESQQDAVRYYQRQGRGANAGVLLKQLREHTRKLAQAKSLDEIRGIEGAASARWFRYLATLLPGIWRFTERNSRPPKDPVNALLSLGYMVVLTRIQSRLVASDFDPNVGFLHTHRAGKPALACDLIEPHRVPGVDRLVVRMLSRQELAPDDFELGDQGCRLGKAAFKKYLLALESNYGAPGDEGVAMRVDQALTTLERKIRQRASGNGHSSDRNHQGVSQ